MTHYVGIVRADSEEELDAILAPYSESIYVDPYWVEVSQERIDFYTERYSISVMEDLLEAEWNDNENKWFQKSTYNPLSKWDWYTIGGRWDDVIESDYDTGYNIKTAFEVFGYLPSVFVDKDGWYESKQWGWWGTYNETKTPEIVRNKLELYENKKCYVVDFHI